MGKDSVCIGEYSSSSLCATDVDLFAITNGTNSISYDGILGLAPIDSSNGPTYIKAL